MAYKSINYKALKQKKSDRKVAFMQSGIR